MAIFFAPNRKAFLRDFRHRASMPQVEFINFSHEQVRDFQSAGFFSQYGQDKFLSELPQLQKSDGIYVDAGCNHPVNINNTFFFERKGWKGIAIDPLPISSLWQHRSAEFIQCALGDTEGTAQVDIPSIESGLQSDNLVRLDMFSQVRVDAEIPSFSNKNTEKTLTVKKRTLSSIFKERKIKHVNFISIDVEGFEINLLKGINFYDVTFDVLSIENNRPYPYGDDKIRRYLSRNGYVHIARIHPVDDIFIRYDILSFVERYKVRLRRDYEPQNLNGEL